MESIIFNSESRDGVNIACTYICPDKYYGKDVLLLHGFSSGQNNSTNMALQPMLLGMGFGVLKFDFRGCGKSAGNLGKTTITSGILDMEACMLEFNKKMPNSMASNMLFFGSSFGGAVALFSSNRFSPKAIILKSPVLDIYNAQEMRRGESGMNEWREKGYVVIKSKAGDVNLNYSYVSDSLNYNYCDPNVVPSRIPISIVHGDKDEIAPIVFTENFVKNRINQIEFLNIHGANHHFNENNDFEIMINFIIREVKKYGPI